MSASGRIWGTLLSNIVKNVWQIRFSMPKKKLLEKKYKK